MTDNEVTIKKTQRNKRKARKIALLFFLTGITTILLIVETYAWFIGTASVKTSEFQIGVSSGDSLMLSLDGDSWDDELTLTEEAIKGTATSGANAYDGNTNIWPSADTGLIPLSTIGESDPAANGRLKLYGKSSITATGGGYRLLSTRINNYGTTGEGKLVSEQDGYVAFDLFIRNGEGVDYISAYNQADDEALYLTTDSKVTAVASGAASYGIENSVRVAFVQIGRIASNGATAGSAAEIGCSATTEGSGLNNTSLCNQPNSTTIWEPNEKAHHTDLITYFNKVCKKKTASADPTGGYTYSEACTPLKNEEAVKTFAVAKNITSGTYVDVYDGLNGFTPTTENGGPFLKETITFTDTMKNTQGAERPAFMYLAPNSITKIRVYIYLEGQDVDNYDLASLGKTVKIQFGFTKDQWDLASTTNAS